MAVAAGLAYGVLGLPPAAKWTVQGSRSLPKLADEDEPRISPNGSMLAYAASGPNDAARITVRNLQDGEPLAVSPPGELAGSPTWASDGVHLAYVVTVSLDAPCRIMVTTFPGGTPHVAGHCRTVPMTQITWRPGTPYLFLQDRAAVLEGQLTSFFDAIFRVNTETGETEQVTSPPLNETDAAARVSPDGEWLAYVRGRGLAGAVMRIRKLVSSEEQELESDPDVEFVGWTPDSKTMLASLPGTTGTQIYAYPIDRILRVVSVDLRHPDHREPVHDRLWDGTVSYRGATYATSGPKPGIWRLDGHTRLLTRDYPAQRRARLAFLGDDVLFPDVRSGEPLRILAQPLGGGPSRPAFTAPAAEIDTPFAVDPRNGEVIYVSKVTVDSDIVLLTLARQ